MSLSHWCTAHVPGAQGQELGLQEQRARREAGKARGVRRPGSAWSLLRAEGLRRQAGPGLVGGFFLKEKLDSRRMKPGWRLGNAWGDCRERQGWGHEGPTGAAREWSARPMSSASPLSNRPCAFENSFAVEPAFVSFSL